MQKTGVAGGLIHSRYFRPSSRSQFTALASRLYAHLARVKKLWQKLKAIAATDEPEHLRRGRLGERAAKAFLQKQGMKFLAANFRSSRGEIDLIFRAGSMAGEVFTGNGTDCLDTFPTHATNNTQRDLVA